MKQQKCKRIITGTLLFLQMVLVVTFFLTGCVRGPDPNPPSTDPVRTGQETKESTEEEPTEDPRCAYDGTDLKVSFLNAGKADVIVIRHGEFVTLIDTGLSAESEVMTDFLAAQGITEIDRLFLTHFDRDHIGGVPALLAKCTVKEVYVPWFEPKSNDEIKACKEALAKASLTPVKVQGEQEFYTEDHLFFQIDAPQKSSYLKDTSNNSSLVIRLSYAGHAFLFCGDAEEERIEELLSRSDWKAEVIKMPHHGGYEKNLEDLLEMVHPRIAVVTCSDKERESKKTADLLSDRGIKTFLTHKGTVTITVEEDRMKDTQKE